MMPHRSLLRRLCLGTAGIGSLLATGCVGIDPRTPDEVGLDGVELELLGVAELAKAAPSTTTPVGGLSALAWQPASGLWYALSDDRGDHGAPPRIFTLRLDVEDAGFDGEGVEVVGLTVLRDLAGRPFAPAEVDPEGLALSPTGTLYVASEGVASRLVDPWVREFRLDGVSRRELPVPPHYRPRGGPAATAVAGDRRGVRDNLGFESLTLTPGGDRLITATEGALVQDGPAAGFAVATRSRVLVWDLATGEVVAEHVYRADPLPLPAVSGGLEIGGLVELLALGGDRLLALERGWAEGTGQTVRLFATTFAGADDVRGTARLPRRVRPMPKRLVLDFARLDAPLDNVEGMALGPMLADGRRSLVFVTDDNFAAHQRTLLHAFAISGLDVPPAPPRRPWTAPPIAEIQGAAHRSPLEGHDVEEVAGVVTAVARRAEGDGGGVEGFWIEDPVGDGDPATSEGLWVAAAGGGGAFRVAPGDLVRVAGRVAEIAFPGELSTTTLRSGDDRVRVVARGATLPTPRRLGGGESRFCPPRPVIDDDRLLLFEPAADGIDFWESLEGMRVELADPIAVGPTSRFGEIAAVAADCAPVAGRTARGGLLVAAGDFHPERIQLDDRLVSLPPRVAVGDRFAAPVVGVVDHSFGNYKLLPDREWPPVVPARHAPVVPPPSDPRHHLTVATLNVENLSRRDGEEKFQALARLIDRLGWPAIVALQEVQDDSGRADDGTVTAAATLDRLVATVRAHGSPLYEWRQVDPEDNADGGAPGGNIRVAYLLDPLRVRPVDRGLAGAREGVEVVRRQDGAAALSSSPGRVAPDHPAFRGDAAGRDPAAFEPSRKSLALEVEVAGRRLFLVNVHFRSKRADDPLFGAVQPPRLASEPQRVAQAEVVARLAGELLAVDPEVWLVVLGDFNDFGFRAPLETLAAAGLVDLVDRLPPAERYTYVYQGNSQVLDHILVSPALAGRADGIVALHTNADLPAGRRASDHDPLVVRFRLPVED